GRGAACSAGSVCAAGIRGGEAEPTVRWGPASHCHLEGEAHSLGGGAPSGGGGGEAPGGLRRLSLPVVGRKHGPAGGVRVAGEAGITRDVISCHGAVLRLYAALNPFQRARLETTGVRAGELNALQAELLHTWKQAARDIEWMRMRRQPGEVIFLLGANSTATE